MVGHYDRSTQTFTITVNEVNEPPVLASIGNLSIDEFAELLFTASATDSDVPANTLSYTLENAPDGAVISSGGNFSWTPTESQGGLDHTFSVVVSDGGAPELSDRETITVSVAEINDPPSIAAPSYIATGNVPIRIDAGTGLLAGVVDSDLPANTLVLTNVDTTSARGGSISGIDLSTGGFTYISAPGYQGTDSFEFTVSDGSVSITQTATVTVSDTIWFVDRSASADGDGTSDSPLNSFAPLNDDSTDIDDPGDAIFVFAGSGSYDVTHGDPLVRDAGLELEDGQVLFGTGVSDATLEDWLAANTEITVAPYSSTLR